MSIISMKEVDSSVVATQTSAWTCWTLWRGAEDGRRLNRAERGGVDSPLRVSSDEKTRPNAAHSTLCEPTTCRHSIYNSETPKKRKTALVGTLTLLSRPRVVFHQGSSINKCKTVHGLKCIIVI